MGLDGGQRPRLTCDRCGRPTWRLWRVGDAWLFTINDSSFFFIW